MKTKLTRFLLIMSLLLSFIFVPGHTSAAAVIEVEVTAYDGAGVAGGGFRMSFVIKGEAISELLKWLIKGLATYIVNLGRASSPIEYPARPEKFFAGLHLRFEVLFSVGMPRMLTALGARVDVDARVAFLKIG